MDEVNQNLTQITNLKATAEAVAKDNERLFALVQSKVSQAIISLSPAHALSFRLINGEIEERIVEFDLVSSEYIKVMFNYLSGKKYLEWEIDSVVTPIAIKATEEAIVEFYSDEATAQIVSQSLATQIKGNDLLGQVLRGEIGNNATWLQTEIRTYIKDTGVHSIAGDAIDTVVGQIAGFFHSEIGKAIMVTVSKFLTTSMGKVIVSKIVLMISEVMATAAFKSAIVTAVKKVGVSVLIKTAVGKAIFTFLAFVGLSGIPMFWIFAAIIAGILVYEYKTFPEKIAVKVSVGCTDAIRSEFGALNRDVIKGLVASFWQQIIDTVTVVNKVEHTEPASPQGMAQQKRFEEYLSRVMSGRKRRGL